MLLSVFFGRLIQLLNNHIRLLHNLHENSRHQAYWTEDISEWWPWLKKHFLYAPLGKKRHHREIQMSKAVSIGTLPSRFHAVLLGAYLSVNILGMLMVDWSSDQTVRTAAVRGRSGYLAVYNMLPLLVLMSRNNPLIPTLKISYDTYNLFHRWIGRMVVLESLIHTFAWALNAWPGYGFSGMTKQLAGSAFLIYGTIGTFAMFCLALHSISAFRHAFWEIFLATHQFLAFVVMVCVYGHLKIGCPPALVSFFGGVIAIWGLERGFRVFRLLYRNIGWGSWSTKVYVQALPGQDSACRVTFEVHRPWLNKPGYHGFIYLPGVSLWMSHPFSIAWYGSKSKKYDKDELPRYSSETQLSLPSRKSNEYSMVIATRSGMTKKLFEKANKAPGGMITLKGFIEGPYGGPLSLNSYGTVLLFAGGVGITHQLTFIRDILAGYELGKVATRKIVLVWSVRFNEQLEWVSPFMNEILQMPSRKEVLKITMFVTKPRNHQEIKSKSEKVLMFPGRPNVKQIVEHEMQNRVGAMAATVCGPGAMADDVREAVRERIHDGTIDFVEEAFTW